MANLQPDEDIRLDEFYAGGPATFTAAFPPVCITSHWDPMLVEQHILPPNKSVQQLPLDPRQAVQVCRQYYTESPAGPLPAGLVESAKSLEIPAQLKGPERLIRPEGPRAIPPGGAARLGFPYTQYAQSIDKESDIYRLDEQLTKCKELRYQPKPEQLAEQTNVLSNQSPELAYKSLGAPVEPPRMSAGCRELDDSLAWNRSARLFFNPTKLDRYHPTQKMGPMVCDPPVCSNPTQAFVNDKIQL